ncbi:unnamed protein product [Protopolystoma xenopodis]|uniref:Uncharacterized protein n=1 Tax=Protopolystoma xenopodis TaxID=117903 RepID=A0A3S5FDF0_9PLAT|nr:unnamed protein product [Protopolystoma xenopodis]
MSLDSSGHLVQPTAAHINYSKPLSSLCPDADEKFSSSALLTSVSQIRQRSSLTTLFSSAARTIYSAVSSYVPPISGNVVDDTSEINITDSSSHSTNMPSDSCLSKGHSSPTQLNAVNATPTNSTKPYPSSHSFAQHSDSAILPLGKHDRLLL